MNKKYSEQTTKTLSALKDAIAHAGETVEDKSTSYWDCVLAFGTIAAIAQSSMLLDAAMSEVSGLSREATLKAGDDKEAWDQEMIELCKREGDAEIMKACAEAAHVLFKFASTSADRVAVSVLRDNGVPSETANMVSILKDCPAEAQDVIKKAIFESLHSKGGSDEKEDATPKRGFTLN